MNLVTIATAAIIIHFSAAPLAAFPGLEGAGPFPGQDPRTAYPITGNANDCLSTIPLRLGRVDVIRGGLSLSVPVSPKLPGRISLGLNWNFHSHQNGQYSEPVEGEADPGSGGTLSPVGFDWDSIKEPSLTTPPTAKMHLLGRTWVFSSTAAWPRIPLPSLSTLLAQGRSNGFEDDGAQYAATTLGGSPVPVSRIYGAADGTSFLVQLWHEAKVGDAVRRAGGRLLFLHGQDAVWGRQEDPNQILFTNRHGDRVSVQDTAQGSATGTPSLVLTNDRYPGHAITARWSVGSREACLSNTAGRAAKLGHEATVTVTNTLGLPTVELKGRFRPGGGFLLERLAETADQETRTSTFEWLKDPDGTSCARLERITHPNGLAEFITYKFLREGDRDWPMVESVSTKDNVGSGHSEKIIRAWREPEGEDWFLSSTAGPVTSIASFPNPVPGMGPCRITVLTHPRNSWSWNPEVTGFLHEAMAVIQQDSYASSDPSSPGTPWENRVYDGWTLKSWANPDGRIPGPEAETASGPGRNEHFGQRVTANPRRVRTYSRDLPMVTVVQGHPRIPGSKDERGPLRTDTWITAGPRPSPSPGAQAEFVPDSALEIPSDFAAHKAEIIARRWNATLGCLEKTSEANRLEIPPGRALRFMLDNQGSPRAWTGERESRTDFTFTGAGFASNETWTLNDARVTCEAAPWSGSEELPGSRLLSVWISGARVPAAPGHDIKVGTEYRYDDSPFHWMTGVRSLVDGRWTTYAVDDLGRPVSFIEPNGTQGRIAYDGWGRVRSVTRLATGGVGPETKDIRHAPDGTWFEEALSVDGRRLATRFELDGWGRITKVTNPDGSTQRTWFDGFGQKIRQTPVMKPGQSSYGDHLWIYDPQGRLCEERDQVLGTGTGRTLLKVELHPGWNGEGIFTTIRDAEGGLHSTLTDILGQITATKDPLGQTTRYFHDRNGYLLKTLQGEQARSWIRNDMGWVLSETEPERGSTCFGDFTSGGSPLVITRLGHSGNNRAQIRIIPDDFLRPAEIRASSPDGVVVRKLLYDPETRQVAKVVETQPFGTFTGTFGYDELGRLVRKTISDGHQTFQVSRTLYDSGIEKSLEFPADSTFRVETGLDALHRVQTLTLNGSPRGQMFHGDRGSGTACESTLALGNGACTTYRWDKAELECVTHQFNHLGSALQSMEWALPEHRQVNHMRWSAGGLLHWRGPDPDNQTGPDGSPGRNDCYTYDSRYRLKSASTQGIHPGELILQEFGYDEFGNRCQSAFQYAPGNGGHVPEEVMAWKGSPNPSTNQLPAMLQGPAGPLTTGAVYDDLGNLKSVLAVPNNSGRQAVSWDYDGALRVVRVAQDGMETAILLDAEGLPFRRERPDGSATYTINGFARQPLSTFILQPGEKDAGPQGAKRPSWARSSVYGFGQLLSEETPSGPLYLQGDLVGSPNLVTDSKGTLVGAAKNLPFGERFLDLGALSGSRFATHEGSAGSTILMQARTYLPSYGRFGQPDPLHAQSPESWNLYSYALNRPVSLHDPSGLASVEPEKKKRGRVWEWVSVMDDPEDPTKVIEVDPTRMWGNWAWVDDAHGHAVFVPDPEMKGPDNDPGEEVVFGSRTFDQFHGPQANQLYPVYVWNYTGSLIPHTFIQTPNITRGFYPKESWHYPALIVTCPGEWRNDSNHPRDSSPAETFWVDAATLARVEQNMNWNPGLYELNNGFWHHAFNCTGWANRVLQDSSLNANWSGVGANPWTN